MKVTLIITTYNWPEALELCLLSVLKQTKLPDEVIVADDGSTNETKRLIQKIANYSVLPVSHSWQKDKGFRAARSRNKAIAKASGEYIIMVDGDIIMEKSFIEDHIANAKAGFFLQGSRVILNKKKTKNILTSGDITLFFSSLDIENRKNCIRSKLLSLIFSRRTVSLNGIRACNSSFWRSDALAINGFNEDFEGWGREDSEFACRLINHGINRFNLRFTAVAFHLYHSIQPRKNIENNNLILEETIKKKITWCKNGLQ